MVLHETSTVLAVKSLLIVSSKLSFLHSQHHLFSFTLSSLLALLGMPALVLFSSLDRFEFLALDLIGLLHGLGNMSMSCDPPDLRHVLVSLFESLIILQLLPLSK